VSDSDQIAVYIDFDNIVISRYDELHGRGAFWDDRANSREPSEEVKGRLATAHVDLAAIIDYAASFGSVSVARAYANWADPVNESYAPDTMRKSIDLVQMFPLSRSKNGADIRLAIDVIDDLSRYSYLSHVLIVAGDSDYVSLAQRCKRLGRTVIGVGADKSVGRYWEAACDEFRYYDKLPGVVSQAPSKPARAKAEPGRSAALLSQAVSLASQKSADGWTAASGLKSLMKRLQPAFDEKLEGHKTFTAYLRAHPDIVEVELRNKLPYVRLREA
jgi:NYN domain/OST-HTH/LOTUS domain